MRYSSYKTGVLELDLQHANIDFILSDLAMEDLDNEVKERSYETLRNAIALHFEFEDEWAKKNNRDFDSSHKKAHKELLEKLSEYGNQYINKKLDMHEICLTLKMELLKHMQEHDIRLSTNTE